MVDNLLLCCDVRLRMQHDAMLNPRHPYFGVFTMTAANGGSPGGDLYEFTFTEMPAPATVVHRGLRVFDGKHLTATLNPVTGQCRLNFKALPDNVNPDRYAWEVGIEVRRAMTCLEER